MVTGSHIPFDRNGIKFYRREGEISKEDESLILETELNLPTTVVLNPLPEVDHGAVQLFIERYVSFFGQGVLSGMNVAIYEHSSVVRDVLRLILETLGATVLSLGRTDTFVPIDTEAVRPEDIVQAKSWANDYTFDAIVSTDGDGDRPLMGDESGQWFRGDVVGILCAKALGVDALVTPVSSNSALEKAGFFHTILRTKIGSPYVIAGMESLLLHSPQALVAGFEANGGFLLASAVRDKDQCLQALPTRDSVLPIVALLVLAKRQGIRVSELKTILPPTYTDSDRLQNVPTALSWSLIDRLRSDPTFSQNFWGETLGPALHWDETDGLRITFQEEQVIHLRPSGNAPELRCYTEASSETVASQLCRETLTKVTGWMKASS
jgi:phosphomannomutase